MTHEEAIDVLETIAELYPNYSITKKKAKILIPLLKNMDYDGVMENLMHYVAEYHYAPTIAEIAAYPKKEHDYAKKIAQWEEEAKKVTPELRREFQEKFMKLFEEKSQL